MKDDVRNQHDLYVNNLEGDVKANPRDFYRYINSQKKDNQGILPFKGRGGTGIQNYIKMSARISLSLIVYLSLISV